MADGAWGQQAQQAQPLYPQGPQMAGLHKRPRTDNDAPSSGTATGADIQNQIVRDNDQGVIEAAKDTKTLGSAYDTYLQSTQMQYYNPGEASNYSGTFLGMNIPMGVQSLMVHPGSMGVQSLMVHPGSIAPDLANGRVVRFVEQLARPARETMPLPQDASNTLYVECLPPNCTKREVAHIFRPFVGYKEVRLVTKESKHRGGDPLILCFVDFIDAPCAATAMSALQGYKMDEDNPDSAYLRIQFSRHPGPRNGGGPRGRR